MANFQNIQGLSELQANIEKLNARLRDQLPDIVTDAAIIVETEIRRRAPVRTGALVANLDTVVGEHSANHASVTVQIEKSDKDGVEHYAIFDEYGTSKEPAKPFFRPGVEAAKQQVESRLKKKILDSINKADGA
jgi:HK97 gp10 family phage protein